MDRDKISNLYRGPSIDATYQISVHLTKRFQRRRFFRNQPIKNKNGLWRPCLLTDRDDFKNRPIINKNCLWWPCLLMDQDKMNNLYRGPSIDASYQISLHLAEVFQRRRLKCEKLTDDRRWTTDDGRWTPSDGKSSHCQLAQWFQRRRLKCKRLLMTLTTRTRDE